VKAGTGTILLAVMLAGFAAAVPARGEDDPWYRVTKLFTSRTLSHSRDKTWKPGKGPAMEVSGLDVLPDGRVAVAIRKGEIWLIDNAEADDPTELALSRFATGLHEPLGLLYRDGDLYVAQRTELTKLRDTDSDGVADEYLTAASGWNVSGNYHEYIFGPKEDGNGNLWLTTNLGIGKGADNSKPWRGWGLMLDKQGKLHPMAAGMRSPSGLGANRAGDMFFTDQQGNWVPTNSLHHLRRGAFYGHPEGLPPQTRGDSPLRLKAKVKPHGSYPEAVRAIPELVPPAVWFPYMKMGRSATDIVLDDTGGKFGPFAGQLFVGDFTHSQISRVFLERVGGEYQGACFPFRSGFPAAVVRLALSRKGQLFVGMTNRGWNSRGDASYGLHRLAWTGKTPFEIKEMRARPDGFSLRFTEAVDPASAGDVSSYGMVSYTYPYSGAYGGDEILTRKLTIESATVTDHGLSVRLVISPLREMFVHELKVSGVRSQSGEKPRHPVAYYTLNRIPGRSTSADGDRRSAPPEER